MSVGSVTRHILFWLIGCAVLWGVLVYLDSRPRFWAWLARTAEYTSYRAREAYNTTKQTEEARNAVQVALDEDTEPLPDADDVIDSIRYFLKEMRRRDP